MTRSLTLFIALRYLFSRKRHGFVSFISLVSMLGIALGVLVLITVLSVFNGFNQVIKQQLFSMVPHITVSSYGRSINNWQAVQKKLQANSSVTAVSPYVSGQALLDFNQTTVPALVYGVDPKQIDKIMHLSHMMVTGQLNDLSQTRFGVILGAGLAARLGVLVGDKVNVFTPKLSISPAGAYPRFRQFKVVGVFANQNGFGFDNLFIFMSRKDAAALYGLGHNISGFHVDIQHLFEADTVARQLSQQLQGRYDVSDWSEQYGAFYHTIQIQKTMMFLIMLLIIAVAAFNLVSSLIMVVNEKQAEIAILRTLGLTPKRVMRIFIYQGLFIALIGIVLGVIGGVILSLNITGVVNIIQSVFHVKLLSASVNFVDYLPSKLEFGDIFDVSLIAFLLALAATLYPAYKASKVPVVEALHHE